MADYYGRDSYHDVSSANDKVENGNCNEPRVQSNNFNFNDFYNTKIQNNGYGKRMILINSLRQGAHEEVIFTVISYSKKKIRL